MTYFLWAGTSLCGGKDRLMTKALCVLRKVFTDRQRHSLNYVWLPLTSSILISYHPEARTITIHKIKVAVCSDETLHMNQRVAIAVTHGHNREIWRKRG